MPQNILLLSIQQKYAKRILEGSKSVELRRVKPSINTGDWVFLYVTSPTKAIVGGFEVDRIITKHPNHLWPLVKNIAGISKDEYKTYYKDASTGSAIFVKKAWRLKIPISLDALKKRDSCFHPPRSFSYLKNHKRPTTKILSMLQKNGDQKQPQPQTLV